MNNNSHDAVYLLREIVYLAEEFGTCNHQGILHLGKPAVCFWQLKKSTNGGDESLVLNDSRVVAQNEGDGATLRDDTLETGKAEVD